MSVEHQKNYETNKSDLYLPYSVDFMLLGACNLKCPFCYGPNHKIPPMETPLVVSLLGSLAKNGVKKVVFTGGEPTLIDDLPVIIDTAKSLGLSTVLSTNGIRLNHDPQFLEQIANSLDWIGLPLDGDNAWINGVMRLGTNEYPNLEHFEGIFSLTRKIRQKYPLLGIKLGTVVSRINSDSVIGIPRVLAERDSLPDTWKIYQVSPSEYGRINYPALEIEDSRFEEIFESAYREGIKIGIKNIVKYSNSSRPGKYFFISPIGQALTVHPETNDYFVVGNLVTNIDSVITSWNQYIVKERLEKNYDSTYPDQL